jgi:Tfp pilus assembly protein PilZ
MTVTQTYLMYIVVLLMLELLLRIDMRKRPKAYGWLQSDEENFCNVKQKIVRNTEERSRDTRTRIIWPITIKTSQEVISAEIKNISIKGAFILCQTPLPLKEQFRIAIDIPNQEPMDLAAEVIWSSSNVPEDKVVKRGMGIKFLQSTENARESIDKAIHLYQREQHLGCESSISENA